jgi:hypothetical protein
MYKPSKPLPVPTEKEYNDVTVEEYTVTSYDTVCETDEFRWDICSVDRDRYDGVCIAIKKVKKVLETDEEFADRRKLMEGHHIRYDQAMKDYIKWEKETEEREEKEKLAKEKLLYEELKKKFEKV